MCIECIVHRRLYSMTDNSVKTNFIHTFHLENAALKDNNGCNNFIVAVVVIVIGFLNLYGRRHERQKHTYLNEKCRIIYL